MKKTRTIVIMAAIIGAFTSAMFLLYLLKDHLKGCPLCGKLFDAEQEEEYMEEEAPEEFAVPEKEEKQEKRSNANKVRRGYIPLKFHTKENNA